MSCVHCRLYFWVIGLVVALGVVGSKASADEFEWTNPVDGDFDQAIRWKNLTGSDPLPGIGDTVTFNESGAYFVTFPNAGSAWVSDKVDVTNGFVNFAGNAGIQTTYKVTAGEADVNINGGNLTLGSGGNRLQLNVGDMLDINGGTLTVQVGSDLDVDGPVAIGNLGGAHIVVSGAGSTVDFAQTVSIRAGNLDVSGLTFEDASLGSEIHQALNMGTSGALAEFVGLNVLSGSNLTTSDINVADVGSGNTIAVVTVDGTDSELTMSGASTFTVGSALNFMVDADVIVSDGGTFHTGTGLTTVHEGAAIAVNDAGSTINFNGDLMINGGEVKTTFPAAFSFAGQTIIDVNSGGELSGHAFTFEGEQVNVDASELTASSTLSAFGTSVPTRVTYKNGASGFIQNLIVATDASGSTPSAEVHVQSGSQLDVVFMRIANFDTHDADGSVTVTGTGSIVDMSPFVGIVTVGSATQGTGTLTVESGGVFRTGFGMSTVNPTGTINVSGGFGVTAFTANGDVLVDGGTINLPSFFSKAFQLADGVTMTIQNGGEFLATNFVTLETDATIDIEAGGLMEIGGVLELDGSFRINLNGGELRARGIELTNGDLIFRSGRLAVEAISRSITNRGGTLAPGGSPGITTVLGNYTTEGTGATLEIELGGTAVASEYDRLLTTGRVDFDGNDDTLDVRLINGFVPQVGNSFEIVTAVSRILGTFDIELLPGLPVGRDWLVDYQSNAMVLSVIAAGGLLGDFDLDGDVDGSDFLKWQREDGTPEGLVAWEDSYGSNMLSASVAAQKIPEPTSGALMFLVVAIWNSWHNAPKKWHKSWRGC